MISAISSFFSSSTAASIFKGGSAGIKNVTEQPKLAPSLAFGGSLVAGVAAMFIGGFKVADCIRYQTKHGECDAAIEKNLPAIIGGAAALAGCWGGFNTYNPKLRSKSETTELAEAGLVVEEPEQTVFHSASPEYIKKLYDDGMTQVEIAEKLGVSRYAVRKALISIDALNA